MVKEVGNNSLLEKIFSETNSRECTLLLEFSAHQLAYSVLHHSQNKVLLSDSVNTFFDLYQHTEQQLDQLIAKEKIFSFAFAKVVVLLDTFYSTLTPQTFFNENNIKANLAFNLNLPQESIECKASKLRSLPYVLSFACSVHLLKVLDKNFIQKEIKTTESVLLEYYATKLNEKNRFQAHFGAKHLHIFYFKNNELLFNNHFNIDNAESALYNIMNSYKQLHLAPETEPLHLSGAIAKNDAYYNLLYQYIANLPIESKPLKLNYAQNIHQNPLSQAFIQHYFALL